MVEPGGYRRGGIIRDPDAFYETEFYTLPQEKRGYPVWFDTAEQTSVFYKNEQNVYGLANIVTLGIAVYAPADREFLGVLLLNIDLNAFSGAMEGYEEYNDGNTFLIGEDGILMWFNPSISAPAFPRDGLLFQEMKGNGKGISQMNSDGQELLLAYEKIPNTDVFVAHVVDLAVLYAGTYQIRNLCIMVLLAVVIACTVISYYVTSSISEPIGQLIKVMQMTGDGKWNERFPNSGKDEITILGARFNEMADKTDQLIEQVYLSEIRRQEVSISWTNARLDALLMQINPHFLYNTLDTMSGIANAQNCPMVSGMCHSLSAIFRYSLNMTDELSTVQNEMAHVRNYLYVMDVRNGSTIAYDYQIDSDTLADQMPRICIQPVVENALTHGLRNVRRKDKKLLIRSEHVNENLVITVQDNGAGMDAESMNRLLDQNDMKRVESGISIGILNVNARLKRLFGEKYGLHIESTAGEGTTVTITVPAVSTENSGDMENV